jgi:hypothetical protein
MAADRAEVSEVADCGIGKQLLIEHGKEFSAANLRIVADIP